MPDPAPVRVVSLVPSLTESLFDLGAGEAVAGVTDWCTPALPPGVERPRVGGVRDPRVADIVALGADLVVASREENRREDVEALQDRGVDVLVLDPRSLSGAADAVRSLGRAVGRARAAERHAAGIEQARAAASRARAGREPVPVLYPIWREPWITAGPGSYAADVIAAAGGALVGAAGDGRYPPLDLDAAAGQAGVLLLPDEPFDFHGEAGAAVVAELARRGSPSWHPVEVDGRLAAWYGTRSGRRLDALARILDPEGAGR